MIVVHFLFIPSYLFFHSFGPQSHTLFLKDILFLPVSSPLSLPVSLFQQEMFLSSTPPSTCFSTLKLKSHLSSNKRSSLSQPQMCHLKCIHIHTDMHTHFPDVIKSPCSLLPEPGLTILYVVGHCLFICFPVHDSGFLSGRHTGHHSFSQTQVLDEFLAHRLSLNAC